MRLSFMRLYTLTIVLFLGAFQSESSFANDCSVSKYSEMFLNHGETFDFEKKDWDSYIQALFIANHYPAFEKNMESVRDCPIEEVRHVYQRYVVLKTKIDHSRSRKKANELALQEKRDSEEKEQKARDYEINKRSRLEQEGREKEEAKKTLLCKKLEQ
ncbi:MAG: hypothetical protein EOP04_30090, partial [Proteobacteria bacterium]